MYKHQFGVENVDGTAVVTGLTETPIEVQPGERVNHPGRLPGGR